MNAAEIDPTEVEESLVFAALDDLADPDLPGDAFLEALESRGILEEQFARQFTFGGRYPYRVNLVYRLERKPPPRTSRPSRATLADYGSFFFNRGDRTRLFDIGERDFTPPKFASRNVETEWGEIVGPVGGEVEPRYYGTVFGYDYDGSRGFGVGEKEPWDRTALSKVRRNPDSILDRALLIHYGAALSDFRKAVSEEKGTEYSEVRIVPAFRPLARNGERGSGREILREYGPLLPREVSPKLEKRIRDEGAIERGPSATEDSTLVFRVKVPDAYLTDIR